MLLGHSSRHTDLSAHIQNLSKYPVTSNRFSESYKADMAVTNGTRKVIAKLTRAFASGQYNASGAFEKTNYEASIMELLTHPNIVEFLGVTSHLGGRPAIVVAWYPHGNAPTFLEGRSINERHCVMKGVFKGLCYLHGRSPAIAHGDLRGVNILVNDSFEGVISDFSLSKLVKDTKSQTTPDGIAKTDGCIRWMARELLHDEPPTGPTHASDVWAFGCTFYELMLEQLPYSSRKQVASLIRNIIQGTLPFSEEDAMRTGSNEMWAAVRGCWNPVPGDRPSILELKKNLSPLYD